MSPRAAAVLAFWFAGIDRDGAVGERHTRRWFMGGEAFDQQCRDGFAVDVEAALGGDCDGWAETPRGRLALVLLLDQLSRNLFRGSARAFAGDAAALGQARAALAAGEDETLDPIERYFLYMPFMHAESPADQAESVRRFARLADAASAAVFRNGGHHARQHADVVARFGRFPARNAALGRTSTDAERAFLREFPAGLARGGDS